MSSKITVVFQVRKNTHLMGIPSQITSKMEPESIKIQRKKGLAQMLPNIVKKITEFTISFKSLMCLKYYK